ncbi:MAG: oligosaccharide flippase family protein, partial [Bacteroidota bacterium]
LEYPDNQNYVIYFAFIIGFDALAAIPFARLRLENRPLRFALIKLMGVIINISIVLFFLTLCPLLIEKGYDAAATIYDDSRKLDYVFIANLVGSAVALLVLSPVLLKTKINFDKQLWKQMLRYAWPLVIVTVAGIINQFFAIILQKNLLGGSLDDNLATAGVYNAALKVAVLMTLFATAFNTAAEPFFFNQAKRSDSRLIYAQAAQAFTMAASIVLLGILLYLDVLQYLVGKNFREGLVLVPILLVANLCLGLYYNFSIWYKLTDKTIFGAYISVAAA